MHHCEIASPDHAVIINEYIPGVLIEDVPSVTEKQYHQLNRQLKRMYQRGISPSDINEGNIIQLPNGSLTFFDFDIIRNRAETSRHEWIKGLNDDKDFIEIYVKSKIKRK